MVQIFESLEPAQGKEMAAALHFRGPETSPRCAVRGSCLHIHASCHHCSEVASQLLAEGSSELG